MNSHKNRIFKNVLSSILVVLIFACGFLAVVNLCVHSFYLKTPVRGFSMQPTINTHVKDAKAEGDTIYINPYSKYTTNDIVVAKVKWYDHYIIKRVVGTPGDKIEIRDENTHYAVYVNDELLYTKNVYGENTVEERSGSVGYYQTYLNFLKSTTFKNNVENKDGKSYIVLHENEYFLMGDNWGQTTDSLTKGPILSSEIIGKVDLIVDVENENPFYVTWNFIKKIFS